MSSASSSTRPARASGAAAPWPRAGALISRAAEIRTPGFRVRPTPVASGPQVAQESRPMTPTLASAPLLEQPIEQPAQDVTQELRELYALARAKTLTSPPGAESCVYLFV